MPADPLANKSESYRGMLRARSIHRYYQRKANAPKRAARRARIAKFGLPRQARAYTRFIRSVCQNTWPRVIVFIGVGDGYDLAEISVGVPANTRIFALAAPREEWDELKVEAVVEQLVAGRARAKIEFIRPPWATWVRDVSGSLLIGRIIIPPHTPPRTLFHALDLLVPLCSGRTKIMMTRPNTETPDGAYHQMLDAGWRGTIECFVALMERPHAKKG